MKEWLTLKIGPTQWKVFLVPSHHSALKDHGDEGVTLYSESRLYINQDLPIDRRADVLIHELLHAILHVHGIGTAMDLDDTADEKLTSLLAPALTSALGNMLRLPKVRNGRR